VAVACTLKEETEVWVSFGTRKAFCFLAHATAGCLTLQGNEFARKGKWKEMVIFGKVRNLQGTENARKDKLESARN